MNFLKRVIKLFFQYKNLKTVLLQDVSLIKDRRKVKREQMIENLQEEIIQNNSLIRQKVQSISTTRNRNQIAGSVTENQEIVTKMVGGGYTSFVCDVVESQKSNPKEDTKIPEARSQLSNQTDKPIIRGLPGSKRKSCEDLMKSEMNCKANLKYKMLSPNRNQGERLIRKKSDHECIKGESAGSFMMLKKTRSPTFKYFQEIKKHIHHKPDCILCKYCNGCDCTSSKVDNATYSSKFQSIDRCEYCNRSIENKDRKQSVNYEVSLSGCESQKDRGPLKIEDLTSCCTNEKSERGFKLKGNEKASIPTSSSNSNIRNKSISKLRLNYDKALNQIEELKSQNKKLETISKTNCEQIERNICFIEEMLMLNTQINCSLQKSNSICELSVKNYFDFIDIYKDVQNVIINEKDIVSIKLKVDEIMQSHVRVIHEFNLENVQCCIEQNKHIFSSLKSNVIEIEAKLKTLKLKKEVSLSYINSLNGIEIKEEEQQNESFVRCNELDDLLFSTQRQSFKQSTINVPIENITQNLNFDSIDDKFNPEETNIFKETITKLSNELKVLKEESENNSHESNQQKLKIQALQKDLSVALQQQSKSEKEMISLINELNNYKQKCKKLNEKLQQTKSITDQSKVKCDKRIAEITEKHTKEMLNLKDEIDNINK